MKSLFNKKIWYTSCGNVLCFIPFLFRKLEKFSSFLSIILIMRKFKNYRVVSFFIFLLTVGNIFPSLQCSISSKITLGEINPPTSIIKN